MEAAEAQIQEIIAVRDETLYKEEVRHATAVDEATLVYETIVEDAIYEHEEVVKGLRDAYLKDMDLETYIDTLDGMDYLEGIEADHYKFEAKVEVKPEETYDVCHECDYEGDDEDMHPRGMRYNAAPTAHGYYGYGNPYEYGLGYGYGYPYAY